jgi:hypothetical protein
MAEHLDPDTVAAFSERRLSAGERLRVFQHLVTCERCREWVTLNAETTSPLPASPAPPVWAMLAAATIACAFFLTWMIRARPAGEPLATVQPSVTLTLLRPPDGEFTPAWKHVRLTPEFFAPRPANRVVLKTTVGEKWIALDQSCLSSLSISVSASGRR